MRLKAKKILELMALSIFVISASAGITAKAAPNYSNLPHKTVTDINVAEGKNIISNSPKIEDGYGFDRMVDGNSNTPAVFEFGVDNYIMLDLNRAYNIKKIELYSRYDLDHEGARKNIRLEVSNDPEFSEPVVLEELGNLNTKKFMHQGALTVEMDGEKAYRYIRIVKTKETAYSGYGEIKVYADMDVTVVSRDKTATANWWYKNCDLEYAHPQNVLDGSAAYAEGWFSYKEGANELGCNWLQVDLGEPFKIGYIEMSAIPERPDDKDGYQAFDFYGSHFPVETQEQSEYLMQKDLPPGDIYAEESEGYYLLSRVFTADRYIDGYTGKEFPMSSTKTYCAATDNTEAFQYVTYKHTHPTLWSQIGTLDLFVVNPNVVECEAEIGKGTIYFSEEMNFEDIEEKLSVKDSEGNEIALTNLEANGRMITFDAPFEYSRVYNIEVNKVENTDGVPLMNKYTKTLVLPLPVQVDEFGYVKNKDGTGSKLTSLRNRDEMAAKALVTNVTAETTETAVLLVLLYDSEGYFVQAAQSSITIEPGEQKEIVAGMDLPEGKGYSAKAYLWRNFADMTAWCMHSSIE